MSNEYGGPWNQSSEGTVPGPQPGWIPTRSGQLLRTASARWIPADLRRPLRAGSADVRDSARISAGTGGLRPAGLSGGYALPLRTDYAVLGQAGGGNADRLHPHLCRADHLLCRLCPLDRLDRPVHWLDGRPDRRRGPDDRRHAVMLAGMVWTVYNRWFVAGRTGQSLGKRVTHIKLLGELTDAPIGPMNAFIRDWCISSTASPTSATSGRCGTRRGRPSPTRSCAPSWSTLAELGHPSRLVFRPGHPPCRQADDRHGRQGDHGG